MKLRKVLLLSNWFETDNQATSAILKSEISVNEKIITNPEMDIILKDKIIYRDKSFVFLKELNLVMYKPSGYLSANKDNLHPVVLSILHKKYQSYRWQIAGRLDLDVSGLLVLTTSGKINSRITNPVNNVVKTYHATTSHNLTEAEIRALGNYLLLQDQNNEPYLSKFLSVKLISNNLVEVSLSQGKYHQVKNSFLAIKNPLIELKRVKVGNLDLRNLKIGETYEFDFKDFLPK